MRWPWLRMWGPIDVSNTSSGKFNLGVWSCWLSIAAVQDEWSLLSLLRWPRRRDMLVHDPRWCWYLNIHLKQKMDGIIISSKRRGRVDACCTLNRKALWTARCSSARVSFQLSDVRAYCFRQTINELLMKREACLSWRVRGASIAMQFSSEFPRQ